MFRPKGQSDSYRRAPLPLGRPEAGLTLVEVLAAMAILAVALLLLFYPFVSALQYLSKGRARAESQQVARQVMETMATELGSAMEVYLSPDDPAICAFVPAVSGVYPLRPSDAVVRYGRIWRSNPNAAAGSASPVGKSWYDKYSPNPRLNEATQEDTDSQYIARTVFDRSDPADPLYPGGINDPDVLNRSVPAASTATPPQNLIENKAIFVGISPNEAFIDIPILRFDAATQVNETMTRDADNSYVFSSRYPMWQEDWEVRLYNAATGALLETLDRASDPGYVGALGERRGEVDLTIWAYESPLTVAGGAVTLANNPVVPNSESVIVQLPSPETFARTAGTPAGNQYAINYTTGQITFDPTYVADGTNVVVSYQYANYDPQSVVAVATYSTRALIKISLTVSKRDRRDGSPQDIHLEQRVKLKNIVD